MISDLLPWNWTCWPDVSTWTCPGILQLKQISVQLTSQLPLKWKTAFVIRSWGHETAFHISEGSQLKNPTRSATWPDTLTENLQRFGVSTGNWPVQIPCLHPPWKLYIWNSDLGLHIWIISLYRGLLDEYNYKFKEPHKIGCPGIHIWSHRIINWRWFGNKKNSQNHLVFQTPTKPLFKYSCPISQHPSGCRWKMWKKKTIFHICKGQSTRKTFKTWNVDIFFAFPKQTSSWRFLVTSM